MSGNSEKEDLAQLAIELIDNKRVNRDNAFDVKLSFLENLAAEINEKKDKENAWSKASVSIDVSSKVYGYRVDSLHNHAFRISGSLHRSDPLSKNIEQASKLLKEAELGITESKQKSKNNIRKFYAGERTLEKDISNLDKDIIGLEFEIDPLFHHVTAKFDESKTSSLLLNITPVNNQAELSFFNEKSCVKGDEDRYWRLLNPAKAAKEDFEEEERLIQKGENHKPKPKFGKHRESDDVMLQSMFKSFLLSISKFSNPPIRKSCLLHEVESILYKKLKYQDNQCNKLKKKLYESHKTKIKAQSISDKSKLSKRFKAEDEDFKNVKGVFIEKEQLGKKPETNDGASHALADKINTHGQSHPSPFAKDHSDKGIENQDDQSVSLMAGENGEDSIPPMIEDNTGMEHSEPIEQLPQDEPSGHDFSNLNMDEPAEGTESQKKKPKLFLQNVDQENDTAMVNSSTIQKSKNIGTGVQNKKLKHREEFVLAQLNKSGKFLKDADKKGAKKGGNDLENALFHRTQLEDQEERIRKEQKEIRRKRRDLKFKALATAKILNEDYDNFLIDNNPKEKKRFQYPLFSLGKLTTCDTFYEYKAHSTMLSFDSKQAHLATYNGIDINKDPFEDFWYLEDKARSGIIMDVIQINMLQDLISKKCFRNFLKCSTLSPKSSSLEASIPSELNAETYLESNDPALSLTSTSKKMEIKELKKEIWSFSSSKIPKIPESAADRQYADSHSFLEIANQFYFPQIMEEKEEICSIHSLFVCMLHLANENKLYFEADKKKGRKDMNFQVWRYEDPREVDQDKE